MVNVGKQNLINYNKSKAGKTFEEFYGKNKADKLKNLISKRMKLNNPTKSQKVREKIGLNSRNIKHPKRRFLNGLRTGKSIEEIYGIEKATEMRNHYSEIRKGDKNPRWLGGKESWFGIDWDEKREEVLKRDNFTCQICGSKKNLIVHHKIPRRILKNNIVEKMITLCRSCHQKQEITDLKNTHGDEERYEKEGIEVVKVG